MHIPGTLCWLDLMTEDVEAARAFYAAVFGWSYESGGPETGNYVRARVGDRAVAGVGGQRPGEISDNVWTVYFAAEDVAQAAVEVVELGGTVLLGPTQVGDEGARLVAADPAGAMFGLWQAGPHETAALRDAPGAMTWAEVNTRDLDATLSFYADLLDLDPSEMAFPGSRYATLSREAEPIAGVLEMNEQWPDDLPSHWMPYFAVADADAAAAAVRAAGGEVAHGPFDTAFGRIAVIIDPQGAVFSMVQLAQKI